jgi:hypothetical protein
MVVPFHILINSSHMFIFPYHSTLSKCSRSKLTLLRFVPKTQHNWHQISPLYKIPQQFNLPLTLLTTKFKIILNVDMPSSSSSFKQTFSKTFLRQDSVLIPHLPHPNDTPSPTQSPNILTVLGDLNKSWTSSLCDCSIQSPLIQAFFKAVYSR